MARPFWKTVITYSGCGDAPDGNSHIDTYIITRFRFWSRSDEVIDIESPGPCSIIAPSVEFYSTSKRISNFIIEKNELNGNNPLAIVERDRARGGWRWECDDGGGSGWTPTKSEAKGAAKSACGKGGYIIEKNTDLQLVRKETSNLK